MSAEPARPPPEKEKPRDAGASAAFGGTLKREDSSALSVLALPPHSIEVEQSVLGGLLIDNSAFDKVRDALVEADFYRDDHSRIFRQIARLIERGEPAGVVTVDEVPA